ncbi:MAG: HU family DNA-binding protein, partial [Planctomycetaceae bacterium]|nr:HU family DNA-binding protein [Planctomycetaceae bacterium]
MAAKIEVLRKRQLAQALVDKTGAKLKYASAVVDFIFDEIAGAMSKGIKVNVKDFGIFVKAQRKARTGRNPATGEPIKIKASVKPRFTASKALKEAVSGKKYAPHADLTALAAAPAAPAAKAPAKSAAKPAAKPAAKAAAKPAAAKKPAA